MRVDQAFTVIEGKPAIKLPIRQTAKGGESRARPSPGLRPYVLQQISINPQKLDSQDTQAGVCPRRTPSAVVYPLREPTQITGT